MRRIFHRDRIWTSPRVRSETASSNQPAVGQRRLARDRRSMAIKRLGLHFADSEVERRFRNWQEVQVLPVVRFGIIGALTSWVSGLPGFWVSARSAFPVAATWVTCVVLMLLGCLWLTYHARLRRWVLPANAAINTISGFAVIYIGFWAQPSPGWWRVY